MRATCATTATFCTPNFNEELFLNPHQVAEAGPLEVAGWVESVKAADVSPVRVGHDDSDHFLTSDAETGRDRIGEDLLQLSPDVENAFGELLGFGNGLRSSGRDPTRIDLFGEGDDEPEAGSADVHEPLKVEDGGSNSLVSVNTSVVLKQILKLRLRQNQ